MTDNATVGAPVPAPRRREAFLIHLAPGALDEWIARHDDVWPELIATQGRCGVATMSVYAITDELLLVYSEVTSATAWSDLIATDIHKDWVEASRSLNESARADNTVERELVREVLHLDFPVQ